MGFNVLTAVIKSFLILFLIMFNCVLATVRFSLETRRFAAPRRLFAAILSPHLSLDRVLRKEIQLEKSGF